MVYIRVNIYNAITGYVILIDNDVIDIMSNVVICRLCMGQLVTNVLLAV